MIVPIGRFYLCKNLFSLTAMASEDKTSVNSSEENDCNSKDSVILQHRKERKDLQAKIQALKKEQKTATKDKKKKIAEEIVSLEINMDKKHELELNAFKSLAISEKPPLIAASFVVVEPENVENNRVSKAQKRRDKKANEERERQADIAIQEELNKHGPRQQELKAIKKILKSRGLCVFPIQSDGDCLYSAILHQCLILGKGSYPPNVASLRNATAEYLESNKTSVLPYMTNPDTDLGLSDAEFDVYLKTLRSTPAWGGQVEISALVHVIKVPIEVLQATGPPTITGTDEYTGPNVVITYHRHMFSLGAHYNSTRPMLATDEETDSNGDN